MLNRLVKFREEREFGFTLIELLVVIIIIGILAAIAIPVFLNQRQRANDSAVQSAVKSYVNAAESYLVSNPNATSISLTQAEAEGARKSDGVTVAISGNPTTGNGYRVCGYHSNGKSYSSATANFSFQSAGANGGQYVTSTTTCS